jgi:ribosomal protein L12E/L44/L45/RPP1/RPP2
VPPAGLDVVVEQLGDQDVADDVEHAERRGVPQPDAGPAKQNDAEGAEQEKGG